MNVRLISSESAAISSSIRIILDHVEIHINGLHFVSLLVTPDSREATERKKKKRFSCDERVRPPALFLRLLSERKGRDNKEMHNSSFHAHQRSTAIAIYFTITTVQKNHVGIIF